jgi:ribose transport system substrate-binding protein
MEDCLNDLARRDFITMMALGGLGAAGAGLLAGAGSQNALASSTAESDYGLYNSNDEYVYLSIVTQVPFWSDAKQALSDFSRVTRVKTRFLGPPTFDVAGQARQLDDLIAQKPAGIILFVGDASAMTPGINRAVHAGIPVVLCISDAPKSKRLSFLGIDNFSAGQIGARLLAAAIGGRGKVVLGTFPSPGVLDRVKGYKAWLKANAPGITVVDVVNDKADPSYAPQAYAAAISAHPDLAAIAGTDGDSGLGAAQAVKEAGKAGKIKIIAMDRNDDMLEQIKAGVITASVVQRSYVETWYAVASLYWMNHNTLNPVKNWRQAGLNILPERVVTGTWVCNRSNVDLFIHRRHP